MARSIDPRYILRLDDLPKIIQADGRVWPIWLTIRDCARLFHVDSQTIRGWVLKYDLPCIAIGGSRYIEVAALSAWIAEHSMTRQQLRDEWNTYRAIHGVTVDDTPLSAEDVN